MKRFATRSGTGFTLVELIVVIVILGILAAVAVPAYSGYVHKANEAGDLQLLGAMNTAYAAACAELGKDPVKQEPYANLDDEGHITEIGPDEALNTAFLNYFGENTDKAFKVYKALGYDKGNGVFIGDGGTYFYTVSIGGQTVTLAVDSGDKKAVKDSAFGDSEVITMQELMSEVSNLTKFAGSVDAATLLTTAISGTDYAAFSAKMAGCTDEEIEAFKKYMANPTAPPEDLTLLQDFTTKTAAFETAVKAGIDDSTFKTNMLVLYAAENSKNIDVDTMLASIKSKNNTLDILSGADGKLDTISGQDVADFAVAYGVATAYCYRTNENASTLTPSDINQVLQTEEFKAYMDTPQARVDLEGYLSCMNLMNENLESGNIEYSYVLQNGFADSDVVAALNTVFDQGGD